jgi:hypothetical protein
MKQLMRVTAILSMVALASAAQADLNRAGPPNVPSPPGHGFPAWYQDLNGLALDFCLPNATDPSSLQQAACLLVGAGLPTPPYVFATNFPGEVFYYRAVSVPLDTSDPALGGVVKAVLVLALEGSFATGSAAPGQQIVFTRIRVTAGVPHSGTYTVTHPYGIETFVVDNATGARDIFFSEDVGIAPGVFTDALSSRVGPFLQASTVAGGAPKPPVAIPAGSTDLFLSDGVALEQLTGSPFGTNYFEICGPFDGPLKADSCRKTSSFTLTGRLHNGAIASPLRVDRATYSRAGAAAQVDVSANAKAGIGQPAPKLTAAASTVSPVLLDGPTALGEWYGQGIPVPSDAIPSVLTVINSSDVPPTAVTAHVTDLVTVKSATYAAGTLTVIATSSDKGDPATLIPPPTLVLDGIPGAVSLPSGGAADPAERTFTVALPVPAVPPPTVRVSSSVGGQGQSDVLMGAAAAFPAGVPLAVDDNAVATAGGGLIIIPVLFNDVTNSAALTASPVAIVTTPNIGTATANASGTVNYTPSALSGTATFTYTVSNSVGKSNVATVTVVVGPSLNPVPVAVNDPSAGTLSVTANTSLVINVLANDSGNGGTLNPASILVTSVTGGTAVPNATGTVTYTAGATAGNFSFTYTVANLNGQRSNAATVAVTVTSPETITVKGAQCQNQGTQWQVDGSTTVLTGSMTIYTVSPVPAAPTPAQVLATVPISAGKWQFKASSGPTCVTPISLKSTGGGTRNGVAVTIR